MKESYFFWLFNAHHNYSALSEESSSSRWEKQTLTVLTQLLHGQEESRRMIREMQDELTQVCFTII